MSDALDLQLEAYHRLLPEIRRTYGSVWALVAEERLVRTFSDFSSAAEYALEHHGGEQVLIRQTDERMEMIPFIALAG